MSQVKQLNIMKTTLRIAIEFYAEMTNRSFDEIANEIMNGNEVIYETVVKIMFCMA